MFEEQQIFDFPLKNKHIQFKTRTEPLLNISGGSGEVSLFSNHRFSKIIEAVLGRAEISRLLLVA